MEWKYVVIGVLLGAGLGYFRMKSAPTQMTHMAPGFGR